MASSEVDAKASRRTLGITALVDMPSSGYGPAWYCWRSQGSVMLDAVPTPALHEMSRPSSSVDLQGSSREQDAPRDQIKGQMERRARRGPKGLTNMVWGAYSAPRLRISKAEYEYAHAYVYIRQTLGGGGQIKQRQRAASHEQHPPPTRTTSEHAGMHACMHGSNYKHR